MRVTARTSSFQFRGKGEDVRRIGQELNVSAVLEGSLSQSGEKLHVTAQLIDTRSGYHLWSRAYDGTLSDVDIIQQQIVDQTYKALGVAETRVAARPAPPVNPAARDLYLRGRYFASKRDHQDMLRAVELLQRATQMDPQFARAYAALAEAYTLMGGNAQEPLAKVVPPARAAITRALQLDPNLAEAYATLALLDSEASGQRRQLEVDLRRAVTLSPGYASAHHWLAAILTGQGRFEEADQELRK